MLIDLAKQQWQLAGWRPNSWMLRQSTDLSGIHVPEVGPVAASIPASVQHILHQANVIPDWNAGLNSGAIEWIEHRHGEFFTQLEPVAPGTPVRLEADGLDHSGWIIVDNRIAAQFSGSLVPTRIDLTEALADGKPHRLAIMFDQAPPEQGQIGFTSRTKQLKPRFNYSWDWTPRIVTVGIWDRLALRVGEPIGEVIKIRTELDEDLDRGQVFVTIDGGSTSRSLRASINNVSYSVRLEPGVNDVAFTVEVKPWYPNGAGEQNLYPLTIALDGETIHEGPIGFKRVRWLPCEGAPPNAIPWICEINGKSIFLQGVNWTPVRSDFHSVTREDYQRLIDLYKEMGANCLRVWGGAFLEREMFYQMCDRAGLLVWQEFPLSSSGVDNAAPTDPQVIESLKTIATSYIRRRGHHACKLMWCGGNELCGEPGHNRDITPNDQTHPALAAMKDVVEREDPGVRYVPTSPSGPSFSGDAPNFGKGVHHDVHGPWNIKEPVEMYRDYWAKDDALFRSEVGCPSAESLELLHKYRGTCQVWPPLRENPYWAHSSLWWMQWERFKDQLRDLAPLDALTRYVELSQSLQAEALTIAASACKNRFPKCGGFLVWMGHDAFPCPANTAIIDFSQQPKPAYHALAKVFQGPQL
jgi:beta-mannosidase